MNRNARYVGVALALGVVWYSALLIPGATRQFLLPERLSDLRASGVLIPVALEFAFVCLVSVGLALVFKRLIVQYSTLRGAATLAVVLPLVGTIAFSILLSLRGLFAGSSSDRALGASLGELAMSAVYSVVLVVTRAFFVIIPMGFISQYIMNLVGRSDGLRPGKQLRVATVVAILLALPCMAWMQHVNRTRTVTREMLWSYGSRDPKYPLAEHILLAFANHPDHHVGIYSTDLGPYLESLPTNHVQVTFAVNYDMGDVLGFHEVQIGTLNHWNAVWGYYGVQGDGNTSPWDDP